MHVKKSFWLNQSTHQLFLSSYTYTPWNYHCIILYWLLITAWIHICHYFHYMLLISFEHCLFCFLIGPYLEVSYNIHSLIKIIKTPLWSAAPRRTAVHRNTHIRQTVSASMKICLYIISKIYTDPRKYWNVLVFIKSFSGIFLLHVY